MDCCNNGNTPSIKFNCGERKYVWFKITSCIEQLFVITSATWNLKKIDGQEIARGECELDGTDTLRVLLEPPAPGTYVLSVEYEIPPEIKKAQVYVYVTT